MTDLYHALGIAKSAPKAAIRKAYLKMSKKHHPDAGGNAEAFRAVSVAYRVLSDDERRKKYDESGSFDEASIENERALMLDIIAQHVAAVIQNVGYDVERTSFLEAVRANIRQKIQEGEQATDKYKTLLSRFDKVQKRLKPTSADHGFISMIAAQRAQVEEARAKDMATLDRFKKAIDYLKDYTYEVTVARQAAQQPMYHQSIGQFFSGGTTSGIRG